MQKLALRMAGVIFFVAGALHTWRLFAKFAITVGNFAIPMEWSGVGAALGFVLSLWMFCSAK